MADTTQMILTWLRETATHSIDVEITDETELIEQGVLDSLQVLSLVCFVEDRFGIALPVEEFVPENFKTAPVIAAMVERLCASPAPSATRTR